MQDDAGYFSLFFFPVHFFLIRDTSNSPEIPAIVNTSGESSGTGGGGDIFGGVGEISLFGGVGIISLFGGRGEDSCFGVVDTLLPRPLLPELPEAVQVGD